MDCRSSLSDQIPSVDGEIVGFFATSHRENAAIAMGRNPDVWLTIFRNHGTSNFSEVKCQNLYGYLDVHPK